jgi:Insertion element 4 transposase N-terminal/Transposase DDE domain
MSGGLVSVDPEDHCSTIVSDLDVCFSEALAYTASLTPGSYTTFRQRLEPVWIEEALASTGTATLRKRRLPAEQVVWLVIGMALVRDRPIAEVVRQLDLAMPSKDGMRTVASSSVAQARARLGAEPMEWLFERTATQWAGASADRDRWRGLGLYGVDGTTIRVPDSEENRRHFGSQSSGVDRDGKDRGLSGYPLVKMVTVMALRSHLVSAACFGPWAIDERQYAKALWSSIPEKSLVLLDREYLDAGVLQGLSTTDRHWMTPAKSNTTWRVIETFGKDDQLIEMAVSSEARKKHPHLPTHFDVRAIRYQRKGYPARTLLTSLVDAKQYPASELRTLYHERWEIELGFGELKTDMLQRLEAIRSRSPETVTQELWGLLLAYNLVRLEMERVADETGVAPTRISFVAALRLVVDEWGWSTITTSPGAIPRHLTDLRDKIRVYVLPERRSDRVQPRAVKIKMSNYARKRPVKSSSRSRTK